MKKLLLCSSHFFANSLLEQGTEGCESCQRESASAWLQFHGLSAKNLPRASSPLGPRSRPSSHCPSHSLRLSEGKAGRHCCPSHAFPTAWAVRSCSLPKGMALSLQNEFFTLHLHLSTLPLFALVQIGEPEGLSTRHSALHAPISRLRDRGTQNSVPFPGVIYLLGNEQLHESALSCILGPMPKVGQGRGSWQCGNSPGALSSVRIVVVGPAFRCEVLGPLIGWAGSSFGCG